MKYILVVLLVSFLNHSSPIITFQGSTPADQSIRNSLKISQTEKCDFIKWKLELNNPVVGKFKLNVNYGEGRPNTPGFWGGGHFASFTGNYHTTANIYQLTSSELGDPIILLRLNENLLHLMNAQKKI